ncbi:proline--tRNA ligase [Patescibacteria group bacterium]|nr:proline--tRNA ligase [Patescibacteria group bacterium]
MRQSKLFCKTKKEGFKTAEAISHRLLIRGDFIDQLASGVYSFLPLGKRVHRKIERIIREEMTALGAQEVYLPILTPKRLWETTGRWEKIDPPLFKLKDRHRKEFGLGPTHEEVITELVRTRIKSYRDLPLYLFQIQAKFRNEMRSTGGLLRVREFIMKDLYSFDREKEEAITFYKKVKRAYFRIFKRCGLKVVCVKADPGTIGGELSHEFMVLSDTGEDSVLICSKCDFGTNIQKFGKKKTCPQCQNRLIKKNCIEVGHIFYLAEKYSRAIEANFIDKKGKKNKIIMGCYGIGLGRLMASIVEVHHDEKGIIWPIEVAPFQVHLIPLSGKKVESQSKRLYQDFQAKGIEVLFDDRADITPGEKFADADLIGIPFRIVVSEKTLKKDSVEVKKRSEKKIKLVKIKDLSRSLINLC